MLHRTNWLDLRPILKASSIVGLVAGGIGSWKSSALVGLLIPTFLTSVPWANILFLTLVLLLGGPLALVSSLCLVFLRLPEDQSNILGFLAVVASVSILLVLPYFFLASS